MMDTYVLQSQITTQPELGIWGIEVVASTLNKYIWEKSCFFSEYYLTTHKYIDNLESRHALIQILTIIKY